MCQTLLCPLHISSHLILTITQRDMFFYHSHVIAEETRGLGQQHMNHPLISHRTTDVNLDLPVPLRVVRNQSLGSISVCQENLSLGSFTGPCPGSSAYKVCLGPKDSKVGV